MKMDITEKTLGIVILNYLNYKDTLECVKSLLGQSYKAFLYCHSGQSFSQ